MAVPVHCVDNVIYAQIKSFALVAGKKLPALKQCAGHFIKERSGDE